MLIRMLPWDLPMSFRSPSTERGTRPHLEGAPRPVPDHRVLLLWQLSQWLGHTNNSNNKTAVETTVGSCFETVPRPQTRSDSILTSQTRLLRLLDEAQDRAMTRSARTPCEARPVEEQNDASQCNAQRVPRRCAAPNAQICGGRLDEGMAHPRVLIRDAGRTFQVLNRLLQRMMIASTVIWRVKTVALRAWKVISRRERLIERHRRLLRQWAQPRGPLL